MLNEKLYYGNTLFQWLTVAFLIVLSLLIGRIVYWTFKTVFLRLAKKTKTKLDDIIIDLIEEPLTVMVVLFGFRFAIRTLSLSESVYTLFEYSFKFILTISVTWLVSRLYDSLHKEYFVPMAERTKTDLDDHLLPIIRTGVFLTIWSLGILIALNNAGYDVTAVLAGLGIGGFAFALAIQHTFANMMGGLIIYIDGHVKLGDRVQLQGEYSKIDGKVQNIGWRTTKIKTRYEGRIVSVPNAMITNQELINVETEDGRQVFEMYKVSTDTSIEKLKAMKKLLRESVESCEDTKDFLVTGFIKANEISFDFMLLYWVKPDASNVNTRDAVNFEIVKRMKEQEIVFADRTRLHYNKDVEY